MKEHDFHRKHKIKETETERVIECVDCHETYTVQIAPVVKEARR